MMELCSTFNKNIKYVLRLSSVEEQYYYVKLIRHIYIFLCRQRAAGFLFIHEKAGKQRNHCFSETVSRTVCHELIDREREEHRKRKQMKKKGSILILDPFLPIFFLFHLSLICQVDAKGGT